MVEKEHLVVRASLELNPSRDTTVDAMKGVAVLSVIAAHCGFPLLLWINPSTFFLVAFFLISGFYLNTKQSWWQFVKGKFLRLIVPYYIYFFIVAAVSVLWDFGMNPDTPLLPTGFWSFRNLILEPFTLAHQFHLLTPLWFLTALFEGMLLVAFVRPALGKIVKSTWASVATIVFLLLLAQIAVELSARVNNLSYIAFLYRVIMIFAFICIGYLVWQHRFISNNRMICLGACYLYLFLIWKFNPSYIISWNDYGIGMKRHLFVICNFLGCISLFSVCRLLQSCRALHVFLQLCGRRSFSLMALHMTAFAIVMLVERMLFPLDVYENIINFRYLSAFQRFALFFSGVTISLALDFCYCKMTTRGHRFCFK